MEKHIFSYKNDSKEIVTLVIEPWLLTYEVTPLSIIVFTYTSNEKTIEITGADKNSINIYFDFEQIKVVLNDQDITSLYPLNRLNE
ncbi:hypothetical protein KTJ32_11200 [Acinetobacter gyllenbergii]|nr:hypothetical protein [Acinetobacter gyllenbergii]MCU4581554.1 hypothetical protein [Acinetobacter gyllenbergii]